jgi:hypothetical protein
MSKTKVIILLLFLFISLVFALEWKLIIEAVDKAYKIVGLKTPSYILTIIEKESGFGENLGSNLGSKEENLKRCVNMCYWTEEKNKLDGKKLVYCFDKEKQKYTIEARTQWCNTQYSALEQITSNLGLDINKIPFSPDFGIGYTQFQPTTWLQYRELKNKNPWNLEDSLYAAALKLKYDEINENEEGAIGEYNRNPKYYRDYLDKRREWDQILDDTIFVYDCSSNNFSCALSIIKTNYPECTENDWSIKRKKECIKTKVAFQKEQKLAQKQNEAKTLAYEIQILETKESTPPYIEKAQNLLSSLIDLFTGKQIYSVNNQDNQINSQKTLLNEQNIQQTNQQSKINEQKQEEKITYKEEKKEIIIERKIKENINTSTISLNLNNISMLQVSTSTITSTPTNTSTSTTTTISTLRQQKIPTSNQIFSQTSYIGGGGISLTRLSSKDPCDDYKNKNYPGIIINEIQFETATDTKDEFIELYNPNNEEIDLTCWKLEKYASKQNSISTPTPTLTNLIPSSKFQGKIKPHGFFLITSSSTKEKYQGDLSYAESYSISKNNVIILRKPNGEISDLVGYGDNAQRIYQYENSPFIAQNFENKSIQRKNFQDTDDNSKDFWLHKPSPKNSTFTELPRQDFVDLTTITIQNFNVNSTSTEDGYFLDISFNEPTATFATSTNNYSYDLLISPNAHFSPTTSNLEDFGITYTLPSPKFDGSTTSLSFEINKCPTTSTTYYFALFLKDNLDGENKSNLATSSTTLPEDLCSPGESILVQDISTTTTSTGKILFSEIYIKEGTSTGEFIELYNPNEFDIDLTGWEIRKINRNGKEQIIIPSSKFKGIIPSFSYFLLVNANTSSQHQSELGAGQAEITVNPDFIYPKSYYLAKDNGLILIDKEGKVIDKVCWRDILNTDFQNCISNPTSTSLSLQRKKTATSTPETIINQNLGNAYSTNNSLNDFLYAPINPENSSITRPTIKAIQNFQVFLGRPIITYKDHPSPSGSSYDLRFSWISPIIYDKENLRYELKFASSSVISFQNSFLLSISNINFLDEQEIDFNVYEFYKQTNNALPPSTIFYLALLDDNNNILKLASTTLNANFPQYNGRLEVPKDNVEYLLEAEDYRFYTKIKFTPRYDSGIRYISLEAGLSYPDPISAFINNLSLYLFDDQNNIIATTSVKISSRLGYHPACIFQFFYMLELNQPFLLEKNKTYMIKTSDPSFRFQEFCIGYGFRLEGHMF